MKFGLDDDNTKSTLILILGFLLILTVIYSSIRIVPVVYSQQQGATSSRNLSDNEGNSTDPEIAISQNSVYVVWSDASTGNGDIYLKRSVDNGTTFGNIEFMTEFNNASSSAPRIAADGPNVYIAWAESTSENSEVYLRQSNDNGETFRGLFEISKTRVIDGEYAVLPQLYASGNNIYVAWQDKFLGNNEIFLRASKDAGNKFSGIKNLSQNNTGDSISPQIVAAGNNAFVVWSDTTPGKSEVFLRASMDGGDNFRGIKNVSWSEGHSYDPQIGISENNKNLYVLWEDSSFRDFTFDLVLRASMDGAQTFEDKKNIGRYIGETSDHGELTTRGDNVFVVWSVNPRYSYPPLFDIFFEASGDNGTTFSDAINLSNTPGNSISPKIAVSEYDNGFVIWTEITSGNSDIYFTKLQNLV